MSPTTDRARTYNAVGLDASAATVRNTIERALAAAEANTARTGVAKIVTIRPVAAVVVGLAGGTRAAASPPYATAAVPSLITAAGGTVVRIVSDLAVAFCAATPAPEAYVVIAGTGAVAGHVVGDEVVNRRDGWGWLLGDFGSGFWLGREAVRATLTALDEGLPLGPLARAVLTETGTHDAGGLVTAAYAGHPTDLASLALLVSRHAGDDPIAAGIAERAADRLTQTVMSLAPAFGLPLVLAGSVLTSGSLTARLVGERLTTALGVSPLVVPPGAAGALGALWMAARSPDTSAAVHAKLVASGQGLTATTVD